MESAELFLQMEIEKKLNQKTYQGYSYWTYNRFSLFNLIDVQVNERNPQTFAPAVSTFDRIKRYIRVALGKKYAVSKKLSGGKILVFNHPRRVKNGDVYECVYTDDLIEHLDGVRVLEASYQNMHFEPARTKELIYLDRIEIRNELRYYWYRIFERKRFAEDRKAFEAAAGEAADYIREYFGVEADRTKIADCLFQGYCVYKFIYASIDRILKTMKPEVILECASYCTPAVMIANELAKEYHIPTIELQHGVMGRNHMGYNYLEKDIRQFPDRILTYAEYWNKVTRLPLEKENVIACGYPYFEKNVAALKKRGIQKKRQVVFVSQTVIGKQLSSFAVRLYERVKEKSGYTFLYKLHPGEVPGWQERYPELAASGITVVDNNKRSIYELFAESTVQIGVFSTAVYEGLGFGLKTFLVKAYRSEDMEELCREGYAQMTESIEPVAEYLLAGREETVAGADAFWKKDSVSCMKKAISDTIRMATGGEQ